MIVDDGRLLKTQRAAVFSVIETSMLDHGEFKWIEERVDETYVEHAGIVDRLVHVPTGYYFVFDLRNYRFRGSGRPGRESPRISQECSSWPELLRLSLEWAINLRRQLEASDPWEDFANGKRLLESAGDDIGEFTDQERAAAKAAVGSIEEILLSQNDLAREQIEIARESLEYLRRSVDRAETKRDWLTTSIGVAFTIGTAVYPDKIRWLVSVFVGAIGNAFRLLAGH
jgi:hypothetical protein